MSWVIAVEVSMFQTVQVVSIEDVTTRLGDFSFHEKLVNGAPVLLFWTLLCCTNRVSVLHNCGVCDGRLRKEREITQQK